MLHPRPPQSLSIGYRVSKEKGKLIFHLGYSHSIILEIPKEITVKFDKKIFSLMSANYGLLQNFATIIRSYRLPDSYKGAGVLYDNEIIVKYRSNYYRLYEVVVSRCSFCRWCYILR